MGQAMKTPSFLSGYQPPSSPWPLLLGALPLSIALQAWGSVGQSSWTLRYSECPQ